MIGSISKRFLQTCTGFYGIEIKIQIKILAPAELSVACFNCHASHLRRVLPSMNLLSRELAPVSGDRGAEVMPLFEKFGLVSGARCQI